MQKFKWIFLDYALENYVSNNRQAHEALLDSFAHIKFTVPGLWQQVEHLINSINCTDRTLQASIGLVRANDNNMQEDFETMSSSLNKVEPYRQSSRRTSYNADKDGRESSVVDLRWHTKDYFLKFYKDSKDKVMG